jgi:RNA polymerase sigma-70 factor (ECF subfamily)
MNLNVHSAASPFPTTNWSHVIQARLNHSKAHEALNHLCRKYWRPIYAFARHRGMAQHDAEDLTQAYFGRLLARNYIEKADPAKGRFRAFLIHDLKFFMSNEAGKARAKKRGGSAIVVPIDSALAEARHEVADPAHQDPDSYFDRQWALETVRLAQEKVALSYGRQGKQALFSALQSGLVTPPDAGQYARWQEDLGLSAGALKVALHRLRERFRSAMEAQVMETVATVDDLKSEMDHLRHVLSRTQSSV